jgi:hypothetical protein
MSDRKSTIERDYEIVRDAYIFSLLPLRVKYWICWAIVIVCGLGLLLWAQTVAENGGGPIFLNAFITILCAIGNIIFSLLKAFFSIFSIFRF